MIPRLQQRVVGRRFLSSESPKGDAKQSKENNPDDENSIMLTPGEKVVAASRLTMWAGAAVFAAVCAFYIGRELIPTKMSPNTVFSRALDQVRSHHEVTSRFGTPIRGYGRDHGGKRVGRRNFIEHTEYTSDEDGSKRTRVRFNLEGPHGQGFVFAEVSSAMPSGEFVYLIVQDKANGRVTTIVDNRAALAVGRMTAGSQEGKDAMTKLLTGGK
ncbi:hypothetical protein MHU86_3803 [Fragilaria crotonensis]|nr:hypothetical protein MHU86_3803 [Fragilaria crotonensis]